MEQDPPEGQPAEPAAEPQPATVEHGAGSPVEVAKEKLEEVKEKLAPKIEEAKEKIGPKVADAGKKVQPTVSKLKGMLQQLLGRLRKKPGGE